MATIYDVEANELISKAAAQLKDNEHITAPDWAQFCKTGTHKERPPVDKDWWYTRSAAILRTIYRVGPIGVSKLRTKYGGKKNNGMAPEHFKKGSGSIARKVLQQLEKAGYIVQAQKGVHKGRVVTPQGRSFLDKIAGTLVEKHVPAKEAPKAKPKPKEAPKAAEKPAEKPAPKAAEKPAEQA